MAQLLNFPITQSIDSFLPRYQRHSQQCGEQSHDFPAREMFLQEEPRQQYRDGGVERTNEYRSVQATGLASENEHGTAADVEHAGGEAPCDTGAVHWRELTRNQHNHSRGEKRDEARYASHPEHRAVARFPDAEKVSSESDAGKKCGSDAMRLAGGTFGA